jgi:capsular polysaccharide transport system permease protein
LKAQSPRRLVAKKPDAADKKSVVAEQNARFTPTPTDDSATGDDAAARLDEVKRARLDMARRKEELKALKMAREIEALETMVATPETAETPPPDETADKEPPGKEPVAYPVAPPVPLARARRRHWGALVSFVLMVLAPLVVSAWYLTERAAPRYVSSSGFSVRTEEVGSALDLLGAVTQISGSSSSDTDILYQFIQSQELVARADEALDLRTLWAKGDPDVDPVFSYHPPGTIEDLVDYWERMVGVYSDSGTGLIDLQVQAFTPEDAQRINQFIYDESSAMINRLSAIAREDATRYAREELEQTVGQVKVARELLTRFRNETQIVDPEASIQSQMGILSSLQSQLAQTLIDLDILLQSTREGDPRVTQAQRRIEVTEARIAEERQKLGIGTKGASSPEGEAFADLVGEYERLLVDREFAEESYAAARASYDSAVAEARRQTRYLAAHVRPTIAQSAKHPELAQLLGLVALFSFLLWSILILSAYALRDRR